MGREIHPELISVYRMSRIVSGLLLLCSILSAAMAVLSALLAFAVSSSFILLLTVTAMGGAIVLYRFRKTWLKREEEKFRIGGVILHHTQPRPMVLYYNGTIGFQGPMAAFCERGEQGRAGPVVAALQVSKFHYPPLGESPAELFYGPPETCLLFRRKGKLFFGKAFDRAGLLKEALRMRRVFHGLCATVILGFLAGAGFMGQEALEWREKAGFAKESATWPSATGTIEASRVIKTREKSRIKKSRVLFESEVRYRYGTEKGTFTGERISWVQEPFSREADALRQVSSYRPGGQVTVYYSPETPRRSVLEPGQESRALEKYHHRLMGIAAMLFAGTAVFLLLRFVLMKRLEKGFDHLVTLAGDA